MTRREPAAGEETERLRRQSVLRTEVLPSLTHTVVREAKSSGLLPDELIALSQNATDEYGILNIAAGLYREYQQLMRSQDLIDYDDMKTKPKILALYKKS